MAGGQSEPVKRHGVIRGGEKRYRCGRIFLTSYTNRVIDPQVRALIARMVLNGSGVCDTARLLKISLSAVDWSQNIVKFGTNKAPTGQASAYDR